MPKGWSKTEKAQNTWRERYLFCTKKNIVLIGVGNAQLVNAECQGKGVVGNTLKATPALQVLQ